MSKTLLLIFSLLPALVLAGDITISWTPPTTRVDGTPLPLSEIGFYELWEDETLIQGAIAATESAFLITISAGSRCLKMRTVDTGGQPGPFSDVVCKDVPKAPPSAPVITIIELVGN